MYAVITPDGFPVRASWVIEQAFTLSEQQSSTFRNPRTQAAINYFIVCRIEVVQCRVRRNIEVALLFFRLNGGRCYVTPSLSHMRGLYMPNLSLPRGIQGRVWLVIDSHHAHLDVRSRRD